MKIFHIPLPGLLLISVISLAGDPTPAQKKASQQSPVKPAMAVQSKGEAKTSTGKSDVASQKIFPYTIYQKKLDNGLNVVTVPYNSPGIASFFIVVRAGSRNEIEAGKTGFAHFFEHMMFRGTEKYPAEKYQTVMKSTGASANANTSLDRTLYHMTGDSRKLETMFIIESDRFKNLSYSLQLLKTEAGAVKGEYTKNSANPYVKLNELTYEKAFDVHTYKHTTMGFFEDIVDMPNQYDYSLEFFNRYYRPEYCTIIVVGDVSPAIVNKIAYGYFGDWKPGVYQSNVPAEPEQKETRSVNLKKPGFPPFLGMNYKGPAFSVTENDYPALQILSSAYFGENSDLYNKLVISEKKLRSLDADATTTRDPSLVAIEGSLIAESDFSYIQSEMLRTIEEAKTKPIDPKLLKDTRENFRNMMIMQNDNPSAIAQTLSLFTWLSNDPESVNTYFNMLEKVSADDIMRVAKKYFVPEHLTISTISSQDEIKF